MSTRIQTQYFTTQGDRPDPALRDRGELYIDGPARQIGAVDDLLGVMDFVGIRFHSVTATYVIGDIVVGGTNIWRATLDNGPGVFNTDDWEPIGGDSFTIGAVPPVGPFNGQVWIDTGQADPETPILYFWSTAEAAWVAVTKLPVFRGNHSISEIYRPDDCVVWESRAWTANAQVGPGAFDTADWTPLSERPTYRGDHHITADYLADDVVYESGVIYRALADVAAGAFDPAEWEEVAQRPAYRGDHDAAQAYLAADVVYRDLDLWRCIAPIAAKAWDPADWLSLTQRSKYQGDYDPLLTYLTADVVYQVGRLWRSTAGNAPEAFNPANWELLQSPATAGAVFPVAPNENDLHYLTVHPVGLFIYLNDGTSTQWVQSNGGASPPEVEAYHNPSALSGEQSWRLDRRTNTLEIWGNVAVATSTRVHVDFVKTYARAPKIMIGNTSTSVSGAPRTIIPLNTTAVDTDFENRSVDGDNQQNGNGNFYIIGEWDGAS